MSVSADLLEILKHPLVLLLVTAGLSNYFIPKITKRWQDHQKEIEAKASFVGEMSDAVVSMVMTVQYAELGASSLTDGAYDEAYRGWEINRAKLSARLRGYFPGEDLARTWDRIGELVTDLYALSGTSHGHLRRWRVDRMRSLLPAARVPWDDLAWELRTARGAVSIQEKERMIQTYRRAWFSLRDAILAEHERLLEEVLRAPMASFNPQRKAWFRQGAPAPRERVPAEPTAAAAAAVPLASEELVRYDIFGAIAPPRSDELDEGDPESLRSYAVKWFNYGKPGKALDPITRAIELRPSDAGLLDIRAAVHRELGHLREAERDGAKAVELNPDAAGLWLSLGETRATAGHQEKALEAYGRAAELDPSRAAAWLGKGSALDALGRPADAEEAYRKAGYEPDEARRLLHEDGK